MKENPWKKLEWALAAISEKSVVTVTIDTGIVATAGEAVALPAVKEPWYGNLTVAGWLRQAAVIGLWAAFLFWLWWRMLSGLIALTTNHIVHQHDKGQSAPPSSKSMT